MADGIPVRCFLGALPTINVRCHRVLQLTPYLFSRVAGLRSTPVRWLTATVAWIKCLRRDPGDFDVEERANILILYMHSNFTKSIPLRIVLLHRSLRVQLLVESNKIIVYLLVERQLLLQSGVPLLQGADFAFNAGDTELRAPRTLDLGGIDQQTVSVQLPITVLLVVFAILAPHYNACQENNMGKGGAKNLARIPRRTWILPPP